MKSKKVNLKTIVIIYSVISIMLPFLFHVFYLNMNWDNWYSILFSYLGGAIGGIATLIAIYITTNQTYNIQEESRINEIKPIFDFDCTTNFVVDFVKENDVSKVKKFFDSVKFRIFNLSNYPVKDLKIWITMTSNDLVKISNENGIDIDFIDNIYLKIKESSNPNYGLYNTFGEDFFKISSYKRFLFKENKECYINLSDKFEPYKKFFPELIYQYINNYLKKQRGKEAIEKLRKIGYKLGNNIFSTKRFKIGSFNIKFSYYDIEGNEYNDRYLLNLYITFFNVKLPEYTVGFSTIVNKINKD
ncbi:hypothetical protein [Clostridium tyrobutyricum]|uniref:hypothetical protein n=1 Tax=Clostridium tyrobutyricum TaxID=1519 RepID=UPI0010A9A5AC|nr:hypothetical protein [Clostridium tyrobutyricum]QCH27353.1 hypothetical protein EZN00_00948 [Clostridium tyrobutyricum]